MAQAISIQGWGEPPSDEELQRLVGAVVNVCVGGTIGPEPTPIGNFFRFARVTAVAPVSWAELPYICSRCENEARFQLTVEWEAGYESSDGDVLCEECIDGVVTEGVDAIQFGVESPPPIAYQIAVTYDRTVFERDET